MKNESYRTISQLLSTEYRRYVHIKTRIMRLKNNFQHMENNEFTDSFITPSNFQYYNELYSDIRQKLNRIHITSENDEIYVNNFNLAYKDNTNDRKIGKNASKILEKSKIKNKHQKNTKNNFNFFQINSLCKSSVEVVLKSELKMSGSSPKISANKKKNELISSNGKGKCFSMKVLEILGVWLGEHGNEAYANPMEVAQLSILTGLNNKQIRKWLSNKRSRTRKINVVD
ncbi:hypothetical protein A3Q56_01176 [Intoshia linei]|uniref:Homeobox domain-containing protein n=1 Tax=Intoshia linei TaxID=1819745 RepID=A0A177B9Q8_9BILA|nr:hypothetical protein A3Q56_01176 [Intoshia linei]